MSPTTIGEWLRGDRFPQRIDPLLALVRAVRAQAESAGLVGGTAAALLEVSRWRRIYEAEARRRADTTRSAVEAGQGRAVLERMRPGQPLVEVTDPFRLEVHHAIDSPVGGLPVLPAYVPRKHDRALTEVVARSAGGDSRIAVLVGGSSTGKTRACWEALNLLRERDEPWRLWHPIDPTRPGAVLAELADLAPYTVIWLNEAQFYLAPDQFGEQVAAGLRTLLHDTARAPVLVLATLWPEHWNTLTTRTNPDPHAQARELLDGHKIKVPDAFTGDDLAALAGNADRDPRLGEAAEHAPDGHITQYLAGGPILLDRYQDAPPATRALIDAAMDARRLGAGARIPLAWLADAAPGYLTDTEWDHTGEDWLKQALDYVTTPCNGTPGILTPVKTGAPRNQRNRRTTAGRAGGHPTPSGPGPLYRLADYLDQHGRHHRADQIPPIDFWTAAATHAHPDDLTALSNAAQDRGLYRDAAQLLKHATTHGIPYAGAALVRHLHTLHPTDHRPAHHAATHVPLDKPGAVANLLEWLWRAGTEEQFMALAEQAVAHVSLDNLREVAPLLMWLGKAGAEQMAALAERAVAHVSFDEPRAVVDLLESLWTAGADEQVVALAERAVVHVSLGNPFPVNWLLELLELLWKAKAEEQFVALAEWTIAHDSLGNLYSVATLLQLLCEARAEEQVAALLARNPAAHVSLDDPYTVAWLLDLLRRAEADEQVAVLLARNPAAHVSLNNPRDLALLLQRLREAGTEEQFVALADRAASHTPLDDQGAVAGLQELLRKAGAQELAMALAERAAAHVSLDDPHTVVLLLERLRRAEAGKTPLYTPPYDRLTLALLLERLREAGAEEQVERAIAHVSPDDPGAVADLLEWLWRAGAEEQFVALAERAAAYAPLDNPRKIALLLERLWEAGAEEQFVALAERAAAHVSSDDPGAVTDLLEWLWRAGAEGLAVALAERAAADVCLDNPRKVALLLQRLRKSEAEEQVAALLARNPAAHVAIDDPGAVVDLLEWLWRAQEQEQVAILAERILAAGHFNEFIKISEYQERFRFGREPDGSAAAPWTWEDLE
ncbi:hypothetical protein [Streptomyces sp. NPDC002676]